jgi:two-component system sensor histidine kinase PrrB
VKLSTRTGLAAFAAATITIVVLVVIASFQFERLLLERVDSQLSERASSAPVLVAVADPLAVSELNAVVEGARVIRGGLITDIGRLPDQEFAAMTAPGWSTVTVGREQWRVHAVEVNDVPKVGDRALVELVAPLGDVNARARQLRRRTLFFGGLAAIGAGLMGVAFGRRAARPLESLGRDTARIGAGSLDSWSVQQTYGQPDVDAVATALNQTLDRLAAETRRSHTALEAARSFAAAASHELRTPLQSAMTNLDVARSSADPSDVQPAVVAARSSVERAASALSAVRAYTEVDLVEPSWFGTADLAELADQAVAAVVPGLREKGEITVELQGDEQAPARLWADGARTAIDNLVRNAATHGRPRDGSPCHIVVTVDAATATVAVDDNGPGLADDDRERVVKPFERGADQPVPGSGLGLAFADRVAREHGGALSITSSPLGGTRVVIGFAGSSIPGPSIADSDRST